MSDLSMLQGIVDTIYAKDKDNRGGDVATYIPTLAQADPDAFGIAVTTIRNGVVTAGVVDSEVSIQSVSKPSGESFNAIELDPQSHLPFNPMINAGAISITGMLYEKYGAETTDHILKCFSNLAGSYQKIRNHTRTILFFQH